MRKLLTNFYVKALLLINAATLLIILPLVYLVITIDGDYTVIPAMAFWYWVLHCILFLFWMYQKINTYARTKRHS